jgi:hypothetical protein
MRSIGGGRYGLLMCALVAGLLASSRASVRAQDGEPTRGPQDGEPARDPSLPGPHAEGPSEAAESEAPARERDEDAEESKDPMGWFGFGVKVGYAYVGSSSITVDAPPVMGIAVPLSETFTTPARNGLQLSAPINLGGDGFGWVLEPFYNFNNITSRGLYTGPTFNLHLADPFYLGFGFGVKVGWLKADTLNFGIDIGGRVPFTATLYLADSFALVAEVGIGYTATGLIPKPAAGQQASDLTFGSAFAWDFGCGFRFP